MTDKERNNAASSLRCCRSSESIAVAEHDEELSNNNDAELQMLKKEEHRFPKRQNVDVSFEDVTFTSWSWSFTKFKRETKRILHGVSGEFKSGELTAIMGPSGAGKSTLLNVLAGYITKGSTGIVKLNNTIRDRNPKYRKLSAYIPQEEQLRLVLTAKEAMTFAANLKLGYSVSTEYKTQQVLELLKLLGLDQCHNTLTSRLSGGQRKRLAVALELLSNPPILYLDEPTTGLDSSSCSQCISLLKRLAREGRTIICTIHQPSALLFGMFDKLYSLSEGKCLYEGPTNHLVPYLENIGLTCPAYHNPADYLMEISIGEHGADIDQLAADAKASQTLERNAPSEKAELDKSEKTLNFKSEESTPSQAAVIMQFLLLYKRNLLTTKRCYLYFLNRLLAHIAIGFLFGYLYKNVGSKANTVLANYVYMYGTLLLVVYTGKMSVTLSFPLEMQILTREHFNRWYKLTPYLLSVILIEIPFQLLCTWTYIAISYWLTNQPIDFRLSLFVLFCTLATMCGQSMGYFIGATTPIKIAVFIAPVIACLFSIFGFCIRHFDTPYGFRWLFTISYFRAAFQGVVTALYGFNRQNLDCPEEEMYCHYIDPSKFLKDMDILNVDLVSNISLIVFIWCLMHAATYLTLWFKLNKR